MPIDYTKLLEPLLEKMQQGTIPWKRGWATQAPKNLVSGVDYRGINSLILSVQDKVDPRWVTFVQAKDLGGSVRKGEKGVGIIKYGSALSSEDGEEKKGYRFLVAYTVFNYEQVAWPENGPKKKHAELLVPKEHERSFDAIYERMRNKPPVFHGGDKAFYMPANDSVHMPPMEHFDTQIAYYSTLWHELGHATGHKSRLDRLTSASICDRAERGQEELVAEMTSYFIASASGAEVEIENAAAYCQSWYAAVKKDPKVLVTAASAAQKAADYILGREETNG